MLRELIAAGSTTCPALLAHFKAPGGRRISVLPYLFVQLFSSVTFFLFLRPVGGFRGGLAKLVAEEWS